MASWTVHQVGDWLKTNGFGKHIKTFKGMKYSYCLFIVIVFVTSTLDEDIDGEALMGLQHDDISKLLTILDEDGMIQNPTVRTQRKFKTILEEYQTLFKQERKKRRRSK
jgi:hypothetical protein